MKECDRALKIENPIDPAKESLQEESQKKIATAEGRIAHVQGELKNLQQKSNIASISTWMKNLGTGEEIRLIPIRRATEDPMEARLVQTRRPNEIKRATKTQEERRKEIEVRVAAARLLQKSEIGLGQNEGERSDKGVEAMPGADRRGERRKYGSNSRKNGTNTERKDWVRAYWNSMSLEMKRKLLKIKVSDLKSYFGSSKNGLASDVLNEALACSEENKSWRFWEVLPQSPDNEWIEMINSCSWKPLDISFAVKMLCNRGKCQNGSSPEKESLRDGCISCPVSNNNSDKVYSIEGVSSGEQLQSWIRTKEERMHQGMEILQKLEKEFYHLQSLYERKCEHLSYEQALQAVEDLCLEEGNKRETDTLYEHRSYDSALRQRREKLVENEHDALFISSRFEKLLSSDRKEQLSIELSKIDAQIMRIVTGMQQLELKLELVSAFDYQSILPSLVKSYMRAHLDDLAEKKAIEKSNAAREAFLAELALDSKKSTQGRSDNSRNTLEKGKDKRKNKDYKKTMDSKVAAASEQHLVQDVTNERGSFLVASDGDYPDSQCLLFGNGDDLRQQEEFKWKIEIERGGKNARRIVKRNCPGEYAIFVVILLLIPLMQNSGFPNNLEGMPMTVASEPSTRGNAEGGAFDRRLYHALKRALP
ncbi:UBIQUITIN SPECIFIC PROTEINASE [Salix viminalis]|uniref:UBIQUITIN SPECIFIC PROTEINASE n=1 Tax=Salix viminalis TaxID=40686 RepID=A0A9Q0NMC8_SALVM|nr:UBIQUITIN SPECIFIC PROTEINASE [Salix viminalis]